ncbi:hypothetical protein CTI12_AA349710 [Artemisia annua]|uniref:PB1-like domain-containing protein n=1 Tax=Artemisia annua TaxID=35608 RepID=A0A2U1MRF7_ARTAN|nr:hypothetical protein CTI12_AA349710 [Artemisia annua]
MECDKEYEFARHLFTIRIHHGGAFLRFPDREYVGGAEDIFDRVDIDVFSVFDLDQMVLQLGYTGKNEPLFYHYLSPMSTLDDGLFPLSCDEDDR